MNTMDCAAFVQLCCSFDLETDRQENPFAIAAVFNDESFMRKAPFKRGQVLDELDAFCKKADYLLGHNLLGHDLPVLKAIDLQLDLLSKPVIDTLFLSPLAFPDKPYHSLFKGYKLVRDSLNNPLLDSEYALKLFKAQWEALESVSHELLCFYHYAFAQNPEFKGLHDVFATIGAEEIDASVAFDLFKQLTTTKVCREAFSQIAIKYLPNPKLRPMLAYCLAWLTATNGEAVMPPWVRLQFPEISKILHQLRDVSCGQSSCIYCAATHNPVRQLKRYFGFPAFREKPEDEGGGSLQQAIVTHAMHDGPLFAILPTGGGKSLCFQLPALVRYQRRGLLTIVISPLQALMKDQVDNLREKTGTPHAAALYGMLTAPERGRVLEDIRTGKVALLYISPEQLRNKHFKQTISQRELGCWVFDEAHCLSKWGHDFRPDYLYAARFIKEFAQQQNCAIPPVQCFTATAKQDVRQEILDYFESHLQQNLTVFAGGVERNNLSFEVQSVNSEEDKYSRIHNLLSERLAVEEGSAIVYCAKRKQTEDIADYLQQQEWDAEAFHAGKDNGEKQQIQDGFISGNTQVITATNAFGMGVDKDNVRLVIHADIPGSLENYLQEAGRAGRDLQAATCILLFDENDIDAQFRMSAIAQISQRDIAQILKGLRKAKKDKDGNLVLTTGELLLNDHVYTSFGNEDYDAHGKVINAISWLEKAGYLQRNENRTQFFQGRPVLDTLDAARAKIEKLDLSQRQQKRWLAILETLFNAEADEGFSADELALLCEFAPLADEDKADSTASQRGLRPLYDMAEQGLIKKQLLLSAFVRHKVKDHSELRLERIAQIERALIKLLQESEPELALGEWMNVSLRHLNQELLNQGYEYSNPEVLRQLLESLSKDGKGLAADKGSIFLQHRGIGHYGIRLERDWQKLAIISERRLEVAASVLKSIMNRIKDSGIQSAELLVEFAGEDLLEDLKAEELNFRIKDPLAAIDRALTFLHEQKIIVLQQGLAVFRQAMTIEVLPEAKDRRYNKGDYQPLAHHYDERIFQVHVINEYARLGMHKISHALAFVVAYFSLEKNDFVKRYFADRKDILQRATSQQSFQKIVTDLNNPEQIALACAEEDENLLILAGPGSGKTKVVVHRCAYLLRVKRVPASQILILCFNRNAVTELRCRLYRLVGDDARGVTIQTYHGFSLRLTGQTMHDKRSHDNEQSFDEMIKAASRLLRGETELLGVDEDENRERLLKGYRYILVDEYQDINEPQYELISAIAGRTLDDDSKLSILAVGDDDQNIYTFRGANIEFIRRFEEDYHASQHYLVENYRSSTHIINAANQLISHNHDRMKLEQPIRINRQRKEQDAGGRWAKLDPVLRGRVRIFSVLDANRQAQAVVSELQRLQELDENFDLSECAILASQWQLLDPVRALLELEGLPFSRVFSGDNKPSAYKVRENAQLLQAVKDSPQPLSKASDWLQWLSSRLVENGGNYWQQQLVELMSEWQAETADGEVTQSQLREFLYESLAEQRRERRLGKGVFLSTIHSVKGMEFNHVFILDGGWKPKASEEQRRLFYVAMTRARETLCLLRRDDENNPFVREISGNGCVRTTLRNKKPVAGIDKHYQIVALSEIDIGYAGRLPPEHPVHEALKRLDVASELTLEQQNGRLFLKSGETVVSKFSHKGCQKWRNRTGQIEKVTVIAMQERLYDEGDAQYQDSYKVRQWEVPVIELVFS